MYLPLRLAASAPVLAVVLIAFAFALATPGGRAVYPVYGFPNAFLAASYVEARLVYKLIGNRTSVLDEARNWRVSSILLINCLLLLALAAWHGRNSDA